MLDDIKQASSSVSIKHMQCTIRYTLHSRIVNVDDYEDDKTGHTIRSLLFVYYSVVFFILVFFLFATITFIVKLQCCRSNRRLLDRQLFKNVKRDDVKKPDRYKWKENMLIKAQYEHLMPTRIEK